jgi:hypothetical protein
LRRLAGRKDVEDAFRRLDKLTPEEALMAAAETMAVTRDIDVTVKDLKRKSSPNFVTAYHKPSYRK